MKKYCLSEELYDWDWRSLEKDYVWVVYHYENYGYEGEGELVGFDGENLDIYQLGHCSCYGPLDSSPETISKDKYLNSTNALDTDTRYGNVREKVLKLIQG